MTTHTYHITYTVTVGAEVAASRPFQQALEAVKAMVNEEAIAQFRTDHNDPTANISVSVRHTPPQQ
jgi:hypothetical protein